MKFSDNQKRQMLEEVLIKHRSLGKVAEEFNISTRYFKRLVAAAREHGIDGVLHANSKGSYPIEFKLEVAKFIESGRSYGEAATKFGISHSVGRSWFLKYSAGAYSHFSRPIRTYSPVMQGQIKRSVS